MSQDLHMEWLTDLNPKYSETAYSIKVLLTQTVWQSTVLGSSMSPGEHSAPARILSK